MRDRSHSPLAGLGASSVRLGGKTTIVGTKKKPSKEQLVASLCLEAKRVAEIGGEFLLPDKFVCSLGSKASLMPLLDLVERLFSGWYYSNVKAGRVYTNDPRCGATDGQVGTVAELRKVLAPWGPA